MLTRIKSWVLQGRPHGAEVDDMSGFELDTVTKTMVVVHHDGEGPEFSSGMVLGSGECDRRVSPDGQVRGLATYQACSCLAEATTFAQEQVDAAFHL